MKDTVSQFAAADTGVAAPARAAASRAPWALLQPSALLTVGMLVTAATVIWLSWIPYPRDNYTI